MNTDSQSFVPRFVEFVPKQLDDGVLYVSVEYTTTVHKCACGCGHKVVLPLHPSEWKLTFDGLSITMSPSIGNWSFPCRSHYFITKNRVEWAGVWSKEKIATVREKHAAFLQNSREEKIEDLQPIATQSNDQNQQPHWIRRLFDRFFGS